MPYGFLRSKGCVMSKKVMFVDLMNMFIRNFSALTLTNVNGEHVGGYYGTLSSIRSMVERLQVDEVVIAWEGKQSGERRRKTLSSYKEGRKMVGLNRIFENEQEDERESLVRQISLLKETFEYLPFHQVAIQYQEADDIIAWMVNNTFDGYEKIIVSTDKDYFQLVSEDISVYRPVKVNKKYGQIIDMEYMLESEDCYPPNYTLIKSVCGDKSDKIEGVPRVGEKTFKKDFPFLSNPVQYTINDIHEHAVEQVVQKNKKYQKYIDHKELIEKNYSLVQLHDVRVTIQDMDAINYIVDNNKPKYNPMKFRLKLLTEDVSPKNITDWTVTFSNLNSTKQETVNV